jgi:ankyrin repeat protein
MIKVLLSHSADKSLKNNYGVSPQDLANTFSNYDVKKFLQEFCPLKELRRIPRQ